MLKLSEASQWNVIKIDVKIYIIKIRYTWKTITEKKIFSPKRSLTVKAMYERIEVYHQTKSMSKITVPYMTFLFFKQVV